MKEEILVEQLKAGNKEAFDILYEKYQNLAVRTAYLIMGNLADSEDVVQDTFVKVYLHSSEIQKSSRFKAWMLQIFVRTAYRNVKRKKKEFPERIGDGLQKSCDEIFASKRLKQKIDESIVVAVPLLSC